MRSLRVDRTIAIVYCMVHRKDAACSEFCRSADFPSKQV